MVTRGEGGWQVGEMSEGSTLWEKMITGIAVDIQMLNHNAA